MRRRILIRIVIVGLIGLVGLVLVLVERGAPPFRRLRSTHPCITDESCLRFPVVTGEICPVSRSRLPADFSGEAVLVVVPFDERQQVDLPGELAAAGARTHRERPRLHLLRRAGLSEHVRADAGADSRRHGADHRR
ncbi:MAG: hypothetical protein U0703_29190 [Anaerolineae bacterium]